MWRTCPGCCRAASLSRRALPAASQGTAAQQRSPPRWSKRQKDSCSSSPSTNERNQGRCSRRQKQSALHSSIISLSKEPQRDVTCAPDGSCCGRVYFFKKKKYISIYDPLSPSEPLSPVVFDCFFNFFEVLNADAPVCQPPFAR